MRIASPTLDHLRASNLDTLMTESEGRFPLSELSDASRSGEASSDLVEWLETHREQSISGQDAITDEALLSKKSPTYNGGPHGTRMDGPPEIDLKNYQHGAPDEDLVNR